MGFRSFFQNLLKAHTDAYVLERLESIEQGYAQLRTEQKLFQTDVMDSLLPQLDKMHKRYEQRMKREKFKDTDEVQPEVELTYNGIRMFGGKGGSYR